MYDFWSLGLAAVDTKKTPSSKLGWIYDDKDGRWFNALYSVPLSLIRQYTVMSVNKKEAEIFRVVLDDILRAIPTIPNGCEALTNERKAQLVIANIPVDLAQTNLQVYDYDTDSDHEIPAPRSSVSSWSGNPPPGARARADFIETAVRNKPRYEEIAQGEETKIMR